jgi:hypothetical protein
LKFDEIIMRPIETQATVKWVPGIVFRGSRSGWGWRATVYRDKIAVFVARKSCNRDKQMKKNSASKTYRSTSDGIQWENSTRGPVLNLERFLGAGN